ncbi:MAG: monofunctional biosynthetic peptidoglycan transglycosylase [Bacteroidales bacterium]|nr:monofunctional biosynthetic peptidoglycan transglycosylase [Bacteroidales bacterium]
MKRFFKIIKIVVAFFFISSLAVTIAYKYIPVYITPLMVIRYIEQINNGEKPVIHHSWVPLNKISPKLPLAVVASEDNLFIEHSGFDVDAIKKAASKKKKNNRFRGASTISQQTAKNVFLWPGYSWVRKGLEVYFTFLIEKIWGKHRIMEVYLNSIEMGKGIYGAQEVAEINFKTSALKLNASQCAIIAATLPNPLKFNSAKPSKYMLERKVKILDLMGKVRYE